MRIAREASWRLSSTIIIIVVVVGFGACFSSTNEFNPPSTRFLTTTTHHSTANNNDESDLEEEETVGTIPAVTAAIALFLIGMAFVFEYAKERLEELCSEENRHLKPMVEKLFGEMTVLGFVSIVTFVVTQTGFFKIMSERVFGDDEELLEVFEMVHISLFFVMIFFILQVLRMLQEALQTEKLWMEMDRKARQSVRPAAATWMTTGAGGVNKRRRGCFHELRQCYRLLPLVRDVAKQQEEDLVLLKALRDEFILDREVNPPFRPAPEAYRLSEDFLFGRYLIICLANKLKHMVHVHSATWVLLAIFTIIYYGICVAVKENVKVLMGWGVFLFNIILERHLIKLRSALAPEDLSELSLSKDETSQLLKSSQDAQSLPVWCHVDLDAYMASRSWMKRCLVGGVPNRQQLLFWMDQKGPLLYLVILQVNLIFTGLYCAVHAVVFGKAMYEKEPVYVFALYIILAVLPVFGILLNKKHLVATMSQVCCMGVYRRPQVVAAVLREEKTAHVVRSFIILHKLHRVASGKPRNGKSRSSKEEVRGRRRSLDSLEIAEISKAFDCLDRDGDGFITREEYVQLLSDLGATITEEELDNLHEAFSEDGRYGVTKARLIQWYVDNAADEDISDHERAKNLFSLFEQDDTGKVSIGAFKHKLDAMNAGFTIDEVGAIVNELDEDNDGAISLKEFENLIKKYYPRELAM